MKLFLLSFIIFLHQQPKYKAVVYESDINQTLIYDPETYEILKKKPINKEKVKFSIFQGEGKMSMWHVDVNNSRKVLTSTYKVTGIDKNGTMIAKHTSMGGVESNVLIKITGNDAKRRMVIDFLDYHEYIIFEIPITYYYPAIPLEF